jgi:hypothetical protein
MCLLEAHRDGWEWSHIDSSEVEPDFMAPGCIPIKNKSKITQPFYNIRIFKASQSAHI